MVETISRILEEPEASFAGARLRFPKVYRLGVKRALIAILSTITLFIVSPAVAADPSPPLLGTAYGSYPENYQEIITAWLNKALVDPNSVQVKWLSEPRPGELNVSKTQRVSGFLVDFSVNSRNVFGAFTGPQKHTALIRDGQVVTATGFLSR